MGSNWEPGACGNARSLDLVPAERESLDALWSMSALYGRNTAESRRARMENRGRAINSLLNPFTHLHRTGAAARPRLTSQTGVEAALMRDNYFEVIPDAGDQRSAGSVLTRIYRDIGLAAVAEALRLPPDGFEPEMIESLDRGELFLLPPADALVQAEADA